MDALDTPVCRGGTHCVRHRFHSPGLEVALGDEELLMWLTFVCFGHPDVTGYPMTWTLIAGVNCSLNTKCSFI